jgi:purine nucleoside phosphorylase
MNSGDQKDNAIDQLRGYHAEIAIVLGSGLNSLVADAETGQIIPYAKFTGISQTSVPGHVGPFVLKAAGRTGVIFAQGRVLSL